MMALYKHLPSLASQLWHTVWQSTPVFAGLLDIVGRYRARYLDHKVVYYFT